MDRRLALAALLLAAPAAVRADSDAVFASALDLTIADLRRDSLAIEAPIGEPVQYRDGERRRGGGWETRPGDRLPFPVPFPFPDDRGRDRDRDRGRDGGWRGPAARSCYGFDRRSEEHWRGHGGRGYRPNEACATCPQRHGGCVYRCYVEAWVCTAFFEGNDGSRGRDIEGRRRYDRYDAEDYALEDCRDANWNNRGNGRCRIRECRPADEIVDSGRCQ